jgi:hypothetical protein
MSTETQAKHLRSRSSITKLVSQIKRHLQKTWLQTIKLRSMSIPPEIYDHRTIYRRLSPLRSRHHGH